MTSLPTENINAHTKKLRFLLRNLDELQRQRGREIKVLDFGCGNATAVSQFLIRDGVLYMGVDIHEPSLAYARMHFSRPRASFVSVVPPDAVFDVIIYADNLEHLDDPLRFLDSHVRQLAPDGVVLGAIPNGYGPFEVERWIDRRFRLSEQIDTLIRWLRRSAVQQRDQVPYNHESGHVQFFTRRSLRRLLGAAGLEITRFEKGSFVGAPLSERLVLRGEAVAKVNAQVASFMPSWAVSTWYFRAERSAGTRK
jgi:SAM-dependent methyltransferase